MSLKTSSNPKYFLHYMYWSCIDVILDHENFLSIGKQSICSFQTYSNQYSSFLSKVDALWFLSISAKYHNLQTQFLTFKTFVNWVPSFIKLQICQMYKHSWDCKSKFSYIKSCVECYCCVFSYLPYPLLYDIGYSIVSHPFLPIINA